MPTTALRIRALKYIFPILCAAAGAVPLQSQSPPDTILIERITTSPTTSTANAANSNIPVGSYTDYLIDRYSILRPDSNLHTAVKPYTRGNVYNYTQKAFRDELRPEAIYQGAGPVDGFNIRYLLDETTEFRAEPQLIWKDKPILGLFYKERGDLYAVEGDHFFISVDPVLYNTFGSSSNAERLLFENTRGLEVRASVDDRVSFYVFATDNQAVYPDFTASTVRKIPTRVAPGVGLSKGFKEGGYDFPYTRGLINIDATNSINLQLGHDKFFIGDGMRSLIWSDNSAPFFFFRINTQFWKVNYQNNFMELSNFNQPKIPGVGDNRFRRKYAVFHHLSVNVTKNFNFGLFESIIFQRNDSLGYTEGFDIQYLNPIIFYRAIEYGLGSPDNALLGLNWKWNFLRHFSFYGQFVLDELKFFELTGNTEWWGNKFGIQSGIKYIDAFGIANLDLQYEMNTVRPYMYSYYDDNGSSYTHAGQSLAHPFGANFIENIAGVRYQVTPKVVISNNLFISALGLDTGGINFGQDIFLNNDTRPFEYGVELLQGSRADYLMNELIVSWQFWHNTFLDGRLIYRSLQDPVNGNDSELFYSIGVRMNAVMPNWRW